MVIVKIAGFTTDFIDYDIIAHESMIKENEQGFSVFEKGTESYLLTFKNREDAEDFAEAFDAANLRRKNVSRVWEKFLPLSEDKERHISEENKVLRSKFDEEQDERDVLLAPYNKEERRERFKKLRLEGLPFVPEVEQEIQEFREHSDKPHGIELPPIPSHPDLPSVQELKERHRERLVAFVKSICQFKVA